MPPASHRTPRQESVNGGVVLYYTGALGKDRFAKEERRRAQVKKGDRVKIHFKRTDKEGKVVESNVGQAPLEFSVGKGKVIKGFENAVLGMSPGQTKTVTV